MHSIPENSLIVLFGQNGSGKTRMLKTIESHSPENLVERLGAESLVDELTASSRSGLEFKAVLERIEKIDTLLVDNLWVLATRTCAADCISSLLQERQKEGRLTIVASEFTVDQWATKQSKIAQLLCNSVKVQIA